MRNICPEIGDEFMRKTVLIISAAILCAGLCGCANNVETSSKSSGYYFSADNGTVETKQEKIEKAVEKYVKSHAEVNGKYDSISIGDITENSSKEYSASGKYWVLDSYGDKHCYKFSGTVTYLSGEAKVKSTDFTDWRVY